VSDRPAFFWFSDEVQNCASVLLKSCGEKPTLKFTSSCTNQREINIRTSPGK
jgi:hypothetical protein